MNLCFRLSHRCPFGFKEKTKGMTKKRLGFQNFRDMGFELHPSIPFFPWATVLPSFLPHRRHEGGKKGKSLPLVPPPPTIPCSLVQGQGRGVQVRIHPSLPPPTPPHSHTQTEQEEGGGERIFPRPVSPPLLPPLPHATREQSTLPPMLLFSFFLSLFPHLADELLARVDLHAPVQVRPSAHHPLREQEPPSQDLHPRALALVPTGVAQAPAQVKGQRGRGGGRRRRRGRGAGGQVAVQQGPRRRRGGGRR